MQHSVAFTLRINQNNFTPSILLLNLTWMLICDNLMKKIMWELSNRYFYIIFQFYLEKGFEIMKKFISFFMILVMTCSFFACNATDESGNKDDKTMSDEKTVDEVKLSDFEWENTDGGIAITKYLGNSESITVPEIIENKLVVSVEDTFDGNVVLKELTLPKGVSSVDLSSCTELKKLTSYAEELLGHLPENLEELNMPNAVGFPFYNPSGYNGIITLPENNNLKILNLPSAVGIAECNIPNLEKLTIGKMAHCFYYQGYGSKIGINLSNSGSFFSSNNHDIMISVEYEIIQEVVTEDNIGKYCCEIFNVDSINVNGKDYTAN